MSKKKVIDVQYLNAANIITSFRILGTACLLFTSPFSKIFYIIYTLSGLSDVFDGYVARKTGTTSAFGAMLDSIADLVLYGVMVLKIFPALWEKLPGGIWIAVMAVVAVRIISYLAAAVKYKRFASLHTKLNKITGFAVFMIPYMIKLPVAVPYCIAACTVSAISSAEEMLIHIRNEKYTGKEK